MQAAKTLGTDLVEASIWLCKTAQLRWTYFL
jgi:hypothetical protein